MISYFTSNTLKLCSNFFPIWKINLARNFVLFWALIHNLMGVLVRVPYFYCSGAHCSGVRVFCSKAWMCRSSSARQGFRSRCLWSSGFPSNSADTTRTRKLDAQRLGVVPSTSTCSASRPRCSFFRRYSALSSIVAAQRGRQPSGDGTPALTPATLLPERRSWNQSVSKFSSSESPEGRMCSRLLS